MKLLIVIPAYNEAENIVRVMGELREAAPGTDYVIVNDGSGDETAEICRKNGFHLLNLPANLGLTGAFQTGMQYAVRNGYDAVLQLDADGQHDPRYIGLMAETMERTGCDLVIASRFVTEKKPLSPRMIGSDLISAAIRLTTGKRLTDPTSGMRLWGKSLLHGMAWGMNLRPEPDTLAYLIRSGAAVEEVQVTMRERIAGQSYLSVGKSARYMLQMFSNILLIQWALRKVEPEHVRKEKKEE